MGLWYQELQEQNKSNKKFMEYGDHRVLQSLKAVIHPITLVQNHTTELCR